MWDQTRQSVKRAGGNVMAGGGENGAGFGLGPRAGLDEATIAGLQPEMEAGEVTARRLGDRGQPRDAPNRRRPRPEAPSQ